MNDNTVETSNAPNNEKLRSVIAKIQQLRAISASTHSKAEKETTIALAAKLIAQYQLSEAEVVEKTAEQIDVANEHILYESGRFTAWKQKLAFGLAELNGVWAYKTQIRVTETHKRGSRIRVIGRESDIQICMYMFEYLTSTISELVDDYVPGGRKRGINPERESWCLGCVSGFLEKMRDARDAVNKAATTTAMVFIGNKVEEAENAFKTANPEIKWSMTPASKATLEEALFDSGFKKGKTLTVNSGLEASSESPALQLKE